MRCTALAFVAALLAIISAREPVAAKMPPMEISGGDLPYAVTATWPDTSAFWSAEPPAQPLEQPPARLGSGYQVASWYWGTRLPMRDGRQADDSATYYPFCGWERYACDRGVVQATVGGEEHWLLLDQERDAILRRYVELGRDGLLPAHPTILDVAAARAKYQREWIDVRVASTLLNSKYIQLFWQEALASEPETTYPFPLPAPAVPVQLTYPGGDTQLLHYLPWSGHLIDMSTAGDVSDAKIPVEAMTATPALQELMEFIAREAPLAPARPSAGSTRAGTTVPVWALVLGAATAALMVGGGAFALRRRLAV